MLLLKGARQLNRLPTRHKALFIYQKALSSSKLFDGSEDSELTDDNYSSKSNSLVPQFGENVPKPGSVLILPITRRPIFPGFMSSLVIKNESVAKRLIEGDRGNYVGLFLRKDKGIGVEDYDSVTDIDQLHTVGTFARIQSVVTSEIGTQVVLVGHRRINLTELISNGPPCIGKIKHWLPTIEDKDQSQVMKAYVNEVVLVRPF